MMNEIKHKAKIIKRKSNSYDNVQCIMKYGKFYEHLKEKKHVQVSTPWKEDIQVLVPFRCCCVLAGGLKMGSCITLPFAMLLWNPWSWLRYVLGCWWRGTFGGHMGPKLALYFCLSTTHSTKSKPIIPRLQTYSKWTVLFGCASVQQ